MSPHGAQMLINEGVAEEFAEKHGVTSQEAISELIEMVMEAFKRGRKYEREHPKKDLTGNSPTNPLS